MSKLETYPGYLLNQYRWNYAQNVYDGTAFDYSGDSMSGVTSNAQDYFPKKEQRESKKAYKERLRLIDPATYFATGIDSLVGTMFVSDNGDEETWTVNGRGLGDPTDPASKAYQFINDSNGNGLNWGFFGKQGAIKLAIKHTIFALVEGIPRDSKGNAIGGPSVHLLDPEAVVNKIYESGRLVACRVKEERTTAKTLDDSQTSVTCYVDYTLEGWSRWTLGKDGEKIPFGDKSTGTYTFWRTKERRQRILPIFEISLPLDRPVGYIWARKCITIANMENALEFGYRNSSFAIFQPVASQTQWELIKKALDEGYNAMPSDPEASRGHSFIAPPSDHFDSYRDYIKEKIKNFFYNMFKDYGDVAKEATATQIRLESQSGIEAFLILLAGQADELENQALWRVEQVEFPDSPENWGIAHVRRSSDFSPVDTRALADSLANMYITGMNTVPATTDIIVQVLRKIYEANGLQIPSTNELIATAEQFIGQKAQSADMRRQIGL